MLGLVLGVLLTASASPSVVVAGFRTVEVSSAKQRLFEETFSDALARAIPNARVTSASALGTVLGLERQRQLVGCEASAATSNCMAELAGALGSSVVVTGTVARLGASFEIDVRAAAAEDGHTLAAGRQTVKTEEEILDALRTLAGSLGVTIAPDAVPVTSRASTWVWTAVAVAGVAAAVTGFALGASEHQAFVSAPSLEAARPHATTGAALQVVAWSGVGLAAAGGLGLGISLWPSRASEPSATAGLDGAQLIVGGAW